MFRLGSLWEWAIFVNALNLNNNKLLKACFTKANGTNHWAAVSNDFRSWGGGVLLGFRKKKKTKSKDIMEFCSGERQWKMCFTLLIFVFTCLWFKLSLWKLMMLPSDIKAGGKEYTLNFTHWCYKLLDAIRSSFRKIYDNKYSSQSTSFWRTKSDAAFILYD